MGELIEVKNKVLARGIHYMTSPYGMRTLNGVTKMHNGVDLVSFENGQTTIDYVCAYDDGIVTQKGFDDEIGYYVTINHGSFESRYQHLRYTSILYVGEQVFKGWIVGLMGSTGVSTGAHLDFRIRKDGQWVDPMPYLEEDNDNSWEWAISNGIILPYTDKEATPTNADVVSMLYMMK